MEKSTKQEAEAARFRQDIRSLLHTRVREAIEITLEEELAEALGCGPGTSDRISSTFVSTSRPAYSSRRTISILPSLRFFLRCLSRGNRSS